jgi:twitching motility protein PilT
LAQLDALLRALSEKGASELQLTGGSRPMFCFPEGDRPVSQTVLNGPQISALLSELADQIEAAKIAAGQSSSFTYALPDGMAFDVRFDGSDGTPRAMVRPSDGATGAAPAPVEAAAPALPTIEPGAPEIDRYLRALVEHGGSDLHLSADETPMLRVDGSMTRLPGATTLSGEATIELLRAIMPEVNRKEFEDCHDTDFAYEIEDLSRFRVNVFMDRHGPGGVMRVIPSKILTAEDLNIPPAIVELCNLHKGLVLVTGPTGSGKSTTLAALVDHVNRSRTDHIITIEDPIEFVHPNHKCLVNQREIRTHTGGFKRALRAALRQDPDIVLVGEMRDLETVEIAIETAETGHLVFGTLHTTTAASTVDRIIDQFPADRQGQIRTMLSESLKGVVSQTLLKKNGGGRVAALETLIVIPAIANLIREGKTFQIPSTMQTGKKYGMMLLNDALLELVRKGLVDPEEAHRKAIDKASFANQLRVAGFSLSGTQV